MIQLIEFREVKHFPKNKEDVRGLDSVDVGVYGDSLTIHDVLRYNTQLCLNFNEFIRSHRKSAR